jgi:hypothetical protein
VVSKLSSLEELFAGRQLMTAQFGPSTFYDLLYEGRRYPPKAIVGLPA